MEFAKGLDLIIVVEEKRSLIEVQVREELYGTANQPVCIGKKDEQGNWLFPVKGALDPNDVAICIGERLLQIRRQRRDLPARVARLKEAQQRAGARPQDVAVRIPYFCSGCPHNSSTVVPEGMPRLCRHRLPLHGAVDGPLDARLHPDGRRGRQLDRRGAVLASARTCSRTSATAPTTIPAIMAIRAAIASGVNITYKILFNDAVAMTGGQTNDGGLTVPTDRPPGRGRRRQARRRRHRRAEEISARTPTGRRASPSITATICRRVQKELSRSPGLSRC